MADRFTPLLFPEMEQQLPAQGPRLPDGEARAQALNVRGSFVVEAPAGSGKTGLLIQRYLKLLADEAVTAPEQVLAITFTNKAAGEMRDRVLQQLENARRGGEARSDFEQLSRELAGRVLQRDEALGWRLLEQPYRLNMRTIDSVCAQLARSLPVLSGSAGSFRPSEDAEPLFREAARRTLLLLADGGGDLSLAAALRDLLLHRDAHLGDCEQLIAEMLGVRDQWGMLIPLDRAELSDEMLDREVLPRLQRTLEEAICAELSQVERAFPADLLREVAELAGHFGYAAAAGKATVSPLGSCAGKHDAPQAIAQDRSRWLALAHLMTTKGGEWRKERGLQGNHLEFEYDRKHPWHKRLCAVLEQVQERNDLLEELCRVSLVPDPVYPLAQWEMAKSLFRVLRRALVELQIVFVERGVCDFTEMSLLARAALAAGLGSDEMASALGAGLPGTGLQHLLVDEMQDTSTGQYELIEALTEGWDGASQTVFLVGDPRQSIYLFRQARVENFIRTLDAERLGELKLKRLRLTANFRSQRRLVTEFNEDFARVFQPGPGMVLPYRPADAVLGEAREAEGRRWHARPVTVAPAAEDESEVKAPMLRLLQARRNARAVRKIARRWMARPLPPGRTEPWRIAVLVRNRRHLAEVVSELQKEDLDAARVPYKAIEIEPLNEKQEVLDLLALTRALLHPADRAAGLALLRAPWCGLSLRDLLALTGGDEEGFGRFSVMRLMELRGELLSPEGCARMQRLWRVLEAAHRQRGTISIAAMVERAWRSLGGDLALRTDELTNARRYFELLDDMEARAGAPPEFSELDRKLQRLYGEPQNFGTDTSYVELLTIHRAKGLEWDVVLIPALERWPGRTRPRLLTWAELSSGSAAGSAIMLAPIAARGEEVDGLTRWLKRKYADQEAAERKRLFYVAATRAREELHLFASPDTKATGEVKLAQGSLLQAAWGAAESYFAPAASLESMAVARLHVQPGVMDLAATAEVLEMPSRKRDLGRTLTVEATDESLYRKPIRPEIVRLPESARPEEGFAAARTQRLPYGTERMEVVASEGARTVLARPEGSLAARSAGNAVHALLDLIATRTHAGEPLDTIVAEIDGWRPRVAALLRSDGIPLTETDRLSRETIRALRGLVRDPEGRWVLSAHPGGGSEYARMGVGEAEQALYSVRVDRLFLAGSEPGSFGEQHLWIVDYKTTAYSGSGLAEFLTEQRELYAYQLEKYARVLAAERGMELERVRVGLYYTSVPRLIWWVPGGGLNHETRPENTDRFL